jgi:superfamily I DNA/RNA helicase
MDWTKEQLEVIRSNKDRKLTVDAGPGTGKTAVLCARIAYLIEDESVNPSDIWVVSFTRTAVAELRDRISKYLKDPQKVFGIRIATIDSHAWSVNLGFQNEYGVYTNFEQGIIDVIGLFKSNEGLLEYISRVSHLFVDEAQDIVGDRVKLLLEFVYSIPEEAGITIFSDQAQAIYGFAQKDSNSDIEGTLPENIEKFFKKFEHLELTEIHRTKDLKLINLFLKGRKIVRQNKQSNLKEIERLIRINNHGIAPSEGNLLEEKIHISNDSFFIYRTRAEALHTANILKNKTPYRLRMNGMPNVIHSWIGKIFWDYIENEITYDVFSKVWIDRISSNNIELLNYSWKILNEYFGVSLNRVDVKYMNRRLSSNSPPMDFCTPEFGNSGPIIATIHTSKGREAEDVYLYFPNSGIGGQFIRNQEEEARVYFVGATRAKSHLYVGNSSKNIGRTIKYSSRAFQEYGTKLDYVHFEIGRKEDILPDGLTGKNYFINTNDVLKAQKKIELLDNEFNVAYCENKSIGSKETFAVFLENSEEPLIYLSDHIKADIKNLKKELTLRKNGSLLKNLRILGCRTVAVSEEFRSTFKLHSPWAESGFMLAPMLTGFPLLAVGF